MKSEDKMGTFETYLHRGNIKLANLSMKGHTIIWFNLLSDRGWSNTEKI